MEKVFKMHFALLHQALEKELQRVCQELPKLKAHNAVLAAKLSTKETELVAKQDRLEKIQ